MTPFLQDHSQSRESVPRKYKCRTPAPVPVPLTVLPPPPTTEDLSALRRERTRRWVEETWVYTTISDEDLVEMVTWAQDAMVTSNDSVQAPPSVHLGPAESLHSLDSPLDEDCSIYLWYRLWYKMNSRYLAVISLQSSYHRDPYFARVIAKHGIDGSAQERRNSIANALELRLSCPNPSKCILWV